MMYLFQYTSLGGTTMYSKIKDIRTDKTYKFIRFIEWYHDESTLGNPGHIEHGPHVLGESQNGDKIKIPLNYVDFIKG